MKPSSVKKFKIKNIDCASCAVKVEESISKLDGVHYASLDFASETFHIQADDISKVIAQIKFIEPNAELLPSDGQREVVTAETHTVNWMSLEVLGLITAIIIFGSQITLEDKLHQLSFYQIEFILAFAAYLLVGWNVIVGAIKTIRRGLFFDENVLMVIATVGAFAIHAYAEAIGVMLFFRFGELLQDRAVNRSRRSIRGLLAARPNIAYLKTTNGIIEVAPESIKVGEVILVKPGEKIPLDGEVIGGSSQVDNSALTGESKPVSVKLGDDVLAGAISTTGALTIKVSKLFSDSSIAKVMELVEDATARKAKTEKFITSFARYYTPLVVILALGIATIPPIIFEAPFETWIYRALVMLVISCPCALVVSIPLGYFAGIGKASKQGILVKGSNFLDALTNVKSVVFDKTGTLTEGVFKVNAIKGANGWSDEELLELAAAAESQSTHPIALSIQKAYEARGGKLDESKISEHKAYPGLGVSALYKDQYILVGNNLFVEDSGIESAINESNSTTAHVVVNGVYVGALEISDQLKPDVSVAIAGLRKQGIRYVSMLTGDATSTASRVARELGLDSYHANLLPEDKVEKFENIIDQRTDNSNIVFVGDGINDAPVLARADVGVAMGGLGSDAAIETADVVLMTDSPMKLVESISIAKQTRRIVWQNIVLALSVKVVFLSLGAIGLATMWEAVFADVGTALIAVANSSRILTTK
jgi:Cd2+/Zn2+-exporting ATPase